jgi:hypothetical protein
MKLPHLFDSFCDEERKRVMEEKNTKFFFSFYFFTIEANKGEV